MIFDLPESVEIPEIRLTLRVGAEWRFKIPNYVVVADEYGKKPRFKWIAPLPPVVNRPRKSRRGRKAAA